MGGKIVSLATRILLGFVFRGKSMRTLEVEGMRENPSMKGHR